MGKSLCKAGLVAAFFLCSAIGASAQQPASPQSVIVKGQKHASKWFKAESRHVIVFSDTSHADVTQLLKNLEKLDHLLRVYAKDYSGGRASGQKISLYYHDGIGEFKDAVTDEPEDAVGLYNSCGAGVQGFGVHLEPIADLGDEQLATTPLAPGLSHIFEAYARHFLYRYTDIRTPDSYIDGFAQYFASVRFSENHMVLGRPPAGVARYLYFLDQGHRYMLTYEDILESGELKDMGETEKSAVRLEFLAKSWLLTHYILSSAEHRVQAAKYLDLVHHDVPAAKAFADAFGMTAAELDRTMWRYRLKGIEVTRIDIPSLPSTQISFTSLPEAASDFVLADAALKSCPQAKAGESILRAMSQRAGGVPNNDLARRALNRAQIDWGNAEDALPDLTEATRQDASNFDAFYLLGLANLRLAGQHKDAAKEAYLQAAKRNLARARNLNPQSAEAAFAFYKAELGANDKPGAPALEGAIAAWNNAHEVNAFARSAALAFAYAGRGPEADKALTLLAHNARDPEMAKWAKAWQGRLNVGVSRADLLAEMRRELSPQTAFKEWTVAGEDLMHKVEQNAGAKNLRAYLDAQGIEVPTGQNDPLGAPR